MSRLAASIEELKRNERQWKAFNTPGNCVVMAPPGSGKTKLLSTRIASDLQTIAPPQGAAGITLTNAAAAELRRRVLELGVTPRANLFLGTVHGFALRQILSPFAGVCGRADLLTRRVATSREKTAAFKVAIAQVYPPNSDTRNIRSTVERHRKMIASEDEWNLAGPRIVAVSQAYEGELASEGLVDFEMLVAAAVELVEGYEFIPNLLTAKNPSIYVDEYQDLSPGLDRIIRSLCFDGTTRSVLFAVGDHNQAIYGWTGTRPELLDEVSRHPTVSRVELTKNYRSAREIIDRASRLLGLSGIEGVSDGGLVDALYCRAGIKNQCQEAGKLAAKLISEGCPAHEIGVLTPTNNHAELVVEEFRKLGVPVSANASPYPSTPATNLIEKLAVWTTRQDRPDGEFRLSDLLSEWRSILRAELGDLSVDLALIDAMKQSVDSDELAALFVGRILQSGLGAALRDPLRGEDSAAVSDLLELVDGGQLSDWTIRTLADRGSRTGRVGVYTMSSAKGLEFDATLILGVDQGQIPHFLSTYNSKDLAEDRRKFYVAVTRSRKRTSIFYSGFVQWQSGKIGHNGPSQFLREMGLAE
ncbi:UvrD-helicase domain-containing protein [Kitasatospora sp. NPDC052868]|uniref:UvrD-helicase domain-containing protein n=1 Tax=Kitasatospora sp. NPDC052868 TaxID=3364060 RepID=UPI0037CA93EF